MENENPIVTSLRIRVRKLRSEWRVIRERAGVSKTWMHQFVHGEIRNPTIDTIQSVSDACDSLVIDRGSRARRTGAGK